MREVRRAAIQAQKNCKETLPRARRLTKEMMLYWKKYDKVEKEHRKRAEKEALEQRKLDEEMREVGHYRVDVDRDIRTGFLHNLEKAFNWISLFSD